jgi:hypothetical protein
VRAGDSLVPRSASSGGAERVRNGNRAIAIMLRQDSTQNLRPEIKRIIEALAKSIVEREDREAAARGTGERSAA